MEESQEIVLDVGAISSDEAYAVASESIAERLKAIDGKRKFFDNRCNWDSFKSGRIQWLQIPCAFGLLRITASFLCPSISSFRNLHDRW